MSRRSTVAVSTLVPALKVLSTTLPVSTFFSVVRTNAPPLPGFTCWNAVTDHSWPSRFSTSTFLSSFVVAKGCDSCARRWRGGCTRRVCAARPMCSARRLPRSRIARSDLQQVLGEPGEDLGIAVGDDECVLDPHAAAALEVDAGLHGDGHARRQAARSRGAQQRGLVDLQPHAVPERVHELLAAPRVDDDVP